MVEIKCPNCNKQILEFIDKTSPRNSYGEDMYSCSKCGGLMFHHSAVEKIATLQHAQNEADSNRRQMNHFYREWEEGRTDIVNFRGLLERSVKLQGHYAKLLNMHDGGHRIEFKTADEWIERLKSVAKETAEAQERIEAECPSEKKIVTPDHKQRREDWFRGKPSTEDRYDPNEERNRDLDSSCGGEEG